MSLDQSPWFDASTGLTPGSRSATPPSSLRVRHSVDLGVDTGVLTTIPFDTIVWNNGFTYTLGSGIIGIPAPGVYVMEAVVSWQLLAGSGAGRRFTQIWPNGSQNNQGSNSVYVPNSIAIEVSCSMVWFAASATDNFRVSVFQDCGVNGFSALATLGMPHFSITGPL